MPGRGAETRAADNDEQAPASAPPYGYGGYGPGMMGGRVMVDR